MADKLCSRDGIVALTDGELSAELKAAGLPPGPITATTRKIFERKLARWRGLPTSTTCDDVKPSRTEEDELQKCTSSSSNCNHETNSSTSCVNGSTSFNDQSPRLFYGVCFPPDNHNAGQESPSVFTAKSEALQAVKKVKSARFKVFKTFSEAEKFAASSYRSSDQSIPALNLVSKPLDPGSAFKAPKTQELSKFRRIIEQGKVEEFLSLIKSNPRYLVSSGDTPVILQEGFRYNAMHVAAKFNQREICHLVIETLESDEFWKNFLQEDENSVISFKRKQFLVDLYLNTPDRPDKGNSETPLHFACKFGNADVVEYLVSHPLTKKNSVNKYGETAEQVNCTRCSENVSTLKKKIQRLLEDSVYVPVLGSVDNCTPPRIAGPWSPDLMHGGNKSPLVSNGKGNPADQQVMVKAYAGPMSPSKAAEFHRQWKTPPRMQGYRNKFSEILRRDCDRGLERIGRELAHDQGIPWTEYWSFLGCYADMETESGLEKLEEYLTKRREMNLSNVDLRSKTPENKEESVLKTPVKGVSTFFFSHEQLNDDSDSEFTVQRRHISESPISPIMFESQNINCHPQFALEETTLDDGIAKKSRNDSTEKYVSSSTDIVATDKDDSSAELSDRLENLSLSEQRRSSIEDLNCDSFILSFSSKTTSVEECDEVIQDVDQVHHGKQYNVSKGKEVSIPIFDIHLNNGCNLQCKKNLIEDYDQDQDRVFDNSPVSGSKRVSAESDFSEPFLRSVCDRNKNEADIDIGNDSRDGKSYLTTENITKKVTEEHKSFSGCSEQRKGSNRASEFGNEHTKIKIKEQKINELFLSRMTMDEKRVHDTGEQCSDNETDCRGSEVTSEQLNDEHDKFEDFNPTSLQRSSTKLATNSDILLGLPLTPTLVNDISKSSVKVSHTAQDSQLTEQPTTSSECEDVDGEKERHQDVWRCASVSSMAEVRAKKKRERELKVFIQGTQPSKLDLDVYRAVSRVAVNPHLYPHVVEWKQMVMSFSEAVQQSWPSPNSPRFRSRKSDSRLTWSC